MMAMPSSWRKTLLWFQLALGLQQAALDNLDIMLTLDPSDAHALSSRAFLRHQMGQTDAALSDYGTLTQLGLARAGDWFNLGYIHQAAQRHAQAEHSFTQALRLDDSIDRAWYGLGLTLVAQGQHESALKAFQRNTQLQPMSPHGWCQLARVHMERQEPEEVAKIIRHLQGFEPKIAAELARETGVRPA
jgi:tetratricopeptide (TPR) repeat protein